MTAPPISRALLTSICSYPRAGAGAGTALEWDLGSSHAPTTLASAASSWGCFRHISKAPMLHASLQHLDWGAVVAIPRQPPARNIHADAPALWPVAGRRVQALTDAVTRRSRLRCPAMPPHRTCLPAANATHAQAKQLHKEGWITRRNRGSTWRRRTKALPTSAFLVLTKAMCQHSSCRISNGDAGSNRSTGLSHSAGVVENAHRLY